MKSDQKPFGVTILSLIAFVASPTLMVLFVFFPFNIYQKKETPSFRKNTGEFILLAVGALILLIAFLLLSWLSYTAGLELWKLKEPGRQLASFTMPLFLLVGGLSTAGGDTLATVVGSPICLLSIFFFVDLQLPSIRRKWEAPAAKPS